MTLSMLYKRAVVYPGFIFIPAIGLLSTVLHWHQHSEYLTTWESAAIDTVFALLYWQLICLLSRTIFLNKFQRISSDTLLSWLSWFLLPYGFMGVVIGKALNEYLTVNSTWEIAYALLGTAPFIVGLLWGYRQFKNQP